MVNASTGSPNLARRDDGRATDRAHSTCRSKRRGRAGSAGNDAYRGFAEAIPRTAPVRTAKSVRSGSAAAEHRASDPGEGLRRSIRTHAALARSTGEGCGSKAQWPARIASADQAGLGTGADVEGQELPRHGDG